MTNNKKTVITIGFTWTKERDVMGIWIPCTAGVDPIESAIAYRRWSEFTAFRSWHEIKLFVEKIPLLQGIQQENVARGMNSLMSYIRRCPNKFTKDLRDNERPV